ncbi:uncharacterized protein LDX57_004018 [Aspergillus melleus]|uniref:uncharacterized protein n=1 Tax=Aspergillus melleus TaxID=138277 RepID=UPI001E8D1300|nr:uncharacterized protein LDX57_004018 [Aspergillus melleus]KAH8426271.1 hypothetical protein LDX57_004018 [Aspergillus melleus]
MPINPRLPAITSLLRNAPIPRASPPYVLSLRSVGQKRFEGILAPEWKGTGAEDHASQRTKKGDNTDPTTDSSGAGMQEREESEGVRNDAKSQATTERGGLQHGKQAKKEHPKAPEPIIGMNDERAQKGQ